MAQQAPHTYGAISVVVAVGCMLWTLVAVDRVVPEPYMDEVFHVPQAQRFCAGDFASWDGNITTLPGACVGPATTALLAAAPATLCSVPALRTWSLGWLLLSLFLLSHMEGGSAVPLLPAVIVTFPPLLHSASLFYTDTGAVFWVLATHALLCTGRDAVVWPSLGRVALAGAAGATAILFRQTGVVWLLCSLIHAVLPLVASELRADKALARTVVKTAGRMFPAVLPLAAFAVFLVWNGGVVVGDRSAHTPRPNALALGLAVSAAAAYPALELLALLVGGTVGAAPVYTTWLDMLTRAVCDDGGKAGRVVVSRGKLLAWTCVLAGVAALAHTHTVPHKFNLADNRHVTFYVWSRLLTPFPWLKACLALPFLVCGLVVLTRIAASGVAQGTPPPVAWAQAAAWLLCTTTAILPSPVLEFRYYACSTALAIILMWGGRGGGGRTTGPTQAAAGAALGLHLAAHAYVLHRFLHRPYAWGDGSVARLMW